MTAGVGFRAEAWRATTGGSRLLGVVRAYAPVAVLVIALGLILAVSVAFLVQPGMYPADAMTYLGAGERLNDGHALYAITSGDRAVNVTGSVPLLSPPFIAVLWRPLAALGPWTVYAWVALEVAAVLACVVAAWQARPHATAVATLALIVPLVFTIDFGNVNGLIMGGTVLAMRRPRWAPILIGVMAAAKLWPIFLVLAFIRGRRGLVLLAATLAMCAAVSLLGAGWGNHVAYLDVVRHFPLSDYPYSLGGLTGLPWLAPMAFIAGTLLAIRGSRRAAIAVSILCNPATHPGSWAGLLPALAAPGTSAPHVADTGPRWRGPRGLRERA